MDKIILNAKVYTVNDKMPWAEAIAIKGGKIAAVGCNTDILSFPLDNPAVIDGKGRLVLPGFIDNHCHPTTYTYKANTADLFSCTTIEEYQSTIKDYYEANPGLQVIKGAGWFYADFEEGVPHKKYLDSIIADKPVMLYSGDFHSLWVNSKALELAGIHGDTENPFGGEFAKDAAGEPTGYINEIPAVNIIESQISSFGPEEFKKGLLTFFSQANKAGITAVHDSGILEENGLCGYKALSETDFTLDVFCDCIVPCDSAGSPLEEVSRIILYKELENKHFRANTIKLLMDGVPEANTAMLEDDYLDEPGKKGEPQWADLDRFNEVCRIADEKGYQIQVHAIGDRGVRCTVDALSYAAEINGKRDSRHMIAHLQLCSDKDIMRMKDLGVIVVPTAFWFEKGDMYYQVELFNLGKERADGEYKMKSFIDAGLVVACGSDAPVGIGVPVTDVPFAPVLAIQHGITRCNVFKDSGDPENVLNPSERVTLADMIRSYTINGAISNFAEDRMGTIETGKDANLIILDQDLFSIPITEIYKTKVLLTLFRGNPVYGNVSDFL
ncbi:amidohydrolase [Bacillota bacterium]